MNITSVGRLHAAAGLQERQEALLEGGRGLQLGSQAAHGLARAALKHAAPGQAGLGHLLQLADADSSRQRLP